MEMPNIKLFLQVRPTVLIPVWKLAGFTLGAGCSLLGEKGAMACTVAVGGDILFKLCISENLGCKREILCDCPGGGPGDEALRRPGDRDGGEQPQAGREPDRGDQRINFSIFVML